MTINVGAWTLSKIAVVAVRACASLIVIGSDFAPTVVLRLTVARNENTLSPTVTSPFVPSLKNGCAALPPIEERSPVTIIPVLVGLAPGVTATVSSVVPPGATGLGLAEPTPVGLVGVGLFIGVMEKSSTAKPSSAPDASRSVQRMKKVAPAAMLSPVIDALMVVRFAAALPSSAPAVEVLGLEKSSESRSVYVPVVRLVASVLI